MRRARCIALETHLHAAGIGVEVSDGVVTLAVDLEVDVSGAVGHNDADIAHSVAQVIQWRVLDPLGSVKVLAEDGWTELTAELDWNFQRLAIAASLQHIAGSKASTTI